MSATLKDLAPAEKQKVARLIRQVVEKERQLRELEAATEAAAAERAEGGESAAAAKAEQLAEQNQELAQENTSLRAKLSHAFDLLRAYQHKCRVLDATVQVTGAAGSRPATPGWDIGSGLFAPLGLLGAERAESSLQGSPRGCTSSGGLEMQLEEEAGRSGASSRQLSPVAEGAWEGASPAHCQKMSASAEAAPAGAMARAAPGPLRQPDMLHVLHDSSAAAAPSGAAAQPWPADSAAVLAGGSVTGCGGSNIQLVDPQAALPQLDTLRLMAQALLEAQAEVAAKQAQQARAGAQQAQASSQQTGGPAGPPASWHCAALPAVAVAGAAGVAPPATAVPASAHPGHYLADQPLGGSSARRCGSCCCSNVQPAAAAAPAREPLAVQRHHEQYQNQSGAQHGSRSCSSCHQSPEAVASAAAPCRSVASTHTSCGGGRLLQAFDGDLMDLVRDVEGMLHPEGSACSAEWQAAAPSERSSCGSGMSLAAGRQAAVHQAVYEENDLFDLIYQL